MKKVLFSLLLLAFGLSAMAQQIQLRSADKAECVKSDMTSLNASFSFSTITAEDYDSERGTFSWLSMANTVIGGNEGEPQIPVVNQLIAVPFGAQPRIEITSYSTTDYRLEDLGIHTLVPRQPSIRKDKRPEDVPFVMNEAAYQTRGLRSEPTATVSVEGTMRGVQLGTMTIEPVSYDPVNNTLRVFNDIEVEVHFDGADAQATEDMLLRTYSPAFDNVYAQLFNNRAITDVYTDHPDLYNTPVKMLVICYSGFQGNAALESWLQWKLQKGYYVDIYYTSETGTTASAIASFIKTKYNASVSAGNAYTYLIVIGDTGQVPQYMTKTVDEQCASDLGYSSVNFSSSTSNYFPDMYYSRMSVENTTHLTNYINKVLTYERYEFTDGGNYLNNVILVGGWDSSWTARVAKPTINYATNYYFKSSNTTYGGFENGTISATVSTSSTQGYSGTNNGCYNGINNGVCFLNYTAHGDKQEWYQPKMTAAHVATLTNTGKYFFGVGNCCLTGNFNNTSTTYSPGSAIGTNACFAETMIRVPNAGAVAYVGCSPYSYWYEDFYWAVGAHSYSAGNYPTQSASSKGVYDIMFEDQYWNSASSLLYLGNLAVQQAVTNGNTTSGITDGNCNNSAHYYFQFYHTFGDGSVMPYITKPEVNTVTIPSTVTPGTTSITVNALAGSYVAVTDNSSVIYGVAEANSSGVATVNFTNAIPSSGTLYVVVTRQQYQPYFGTISIVGGTQYTITATASPSNGGTVSGAGQYYGNTSCTLTATPNTGYEFICWRQGSTQVSTDPTYTFTVTGNASYTAIFTMIPQYTITATANPTAGGTVTGAGTYYQNTSCTLTATANTHYEFTNWSSNGAQVSTNPTYTFSVTASGSYTANFTALQPHSVTCNPVENGSISANPTTAYKNETVTLTATPTSGYFFSTWDVRDATNNSITVTDNQFTMPDSDVTVGATFVSGCTITVAEVEHGTVTASTTGAAPGTVVTLTATPESDYYLSTWLVFKTGDVNTTVTVANNQFTLPAYDVTVVGIFKMTQEAEITIGSGTNSNQYLPTYAYYKYCLTQQIYTAAEVGNAGTITAVAFKVQNSKSATRNIDLYMKHTSKSAFSSGTDWATCSNSDKVFSGSVTFNSSGWTTITLANPFEYDGVSNLLVCMDDNTGSYVSSSSNSPKFYVYSTSANRALRIFSDDTNYNPASASSSSGTQVTSNNQVTFTFTVAGNDASLTVSPNAMADFSYAEGNGPSVVKSVAVIGTDLSDDITVTAPSDYEISDEENGTYGSTVTLAANTRGNRETLTYDFEGGWQGWTTFQGTTTSPNSWMHNTEYPTTNNNFSTGYGYNSSDGFMLSESYISGSSSGSGTAVTPDNYLVSPQVTLGGSITFQAGVQNVSYAAEKFSVMVSTTGNTAANAFTTVQTWTYAPNATSGSEWQEFTVDLSAYSGMGYIAIRHFDCYDQWILKVDEITIVEGGEAPVNPTNPTTDLLAANVYVRLKGGLGQGVYNETLAVSTGDVTSNVSLNGEVYPILAAGSNWWTPTTAMTLEQLEEALGSNAVLINTQDAGFVRYENNAWSGTLTSIEPGKMYKIETNAACPLTLTGTAVGNVGITILPGHNWIGYTGPQAADIATALGTLGVTPISGDTITDQNGNVSTYNGTTWTGGVVTLQPGHGYVYLRQQ
ncbi:MAG: choice-of-anchor J domain-containing protein [Bacteroidales bacterium]|nr:choice-of-anchor J domain-containing protein [Bacteroidales bacterium]MBQ6741413.1 choice-of-anchor J domain-containing protein [Bacteroidales bacterium]